MPIAPLVTSKMDLTYVSKITADEDHCFSLSDKGVVCHVTGNLEKEYFTLPWSALGIDYSQAELVDGCASMNARKTSNDPVLFSKFYLRKRVNKIGVARFTSVFDPDFWVEVRLKL